MDRPEQSGGQRSALGLTPLETVAFAAICLVLVVSGGVLAGAHLAATLWGAPPLQADLVDAAVSLTRLPATWADPAGAWPGDARTALPGPVPYYLSLGLVVGTATSALVIALRLRSVLTRRSHPLGVKPHAGLAGPRDLRRLSTRGPEPGRLTLGHLGGRLAATEPQASVAVVGPTGCGKSAGLAIPALLEWDGPVIATSVKTDLVEATLDRRRELGEVWVYDPAGCTELAGSQWSPLPGCEDWRTAMRTAAWLCEAVQARNDSVTDADYWYTQARIALSPHLHAAAIGNHTMREVVRWVDGQDAEPIRSVLRNHAGVGDAVERAMGSEDVEAQRRQLEPRTRAEVLEAVRQVLRADPGKRAALAEERVLAWPVQMQDQLDERVAIEVDRKLRHSVEAAVMEEIQGSGDLDALISAEALWRKEDRLKGSVYATVQNVLLGYADPLVAAAAQGNDIDLDLWLSGSNTIFVVATADEQVRLRPVLTVLVQQAIKRAYDVANRSGGSLQRPCLVLLDEAGNIAPLRDLPSYAATARSHGISLVTVWQDLAQVRAIYGDRAATVLNNHRARVFGSGIADQDTLDYISAVVGDHAQVERNVSTDISGGGRRSVSEHTAYRRALPLDVIRRMDPSQALLLYGSELPAQLRLRPWYADRSLDRLAHPVHQGGKAQGTIEGCPKVTGQRPSPFNGRSGI